MEGGEPGVAHPVAQQALDALAVEAVHVGRHPVGRLRQPPQLGGVPRAPGRLRRAVDEQQPAPQPVAAGGHDRLEARPRPREEDAHRLGPGADAVAVPEELHLRRRQGQAGAEDGGLGLQGRVDHLQALRGDQVARVEEGEQGRPPQRGRDDLHLLLLAVHGREQGPPRQPALAVDAPVRGLGHGSRLRLQPVGLQPHRLGVDDARLQPRDAVAARVAGHGQEVRPHAAQGGLPQAHPHQGAGRGLVGQVAAGPVVDDVSVDGPEGVVAPGPVRQSGVPGQAGHQVGEQVHLARQPGAVHLPREVRGRVEAGAAVVDGDEGEGRTAGQGGDGRVEGHGQREAAEPLAGQVRPQAVDQLQGAPRGRVLVGCGQLQDAGGDRRDQQRGAVGIAGPEHPHPRAARRQVEAGHEAQVETGEPPQQGRVLHLVLAPAGGLQQERREVAHPRQILEVARRPQEHHGARRRLRRQTPGQLQQGRGARGLLRPRCQGRHRRDGVVVRRQQDRLPAQRRVPPLDDGHQVPPGGLAPGHAPGEAHTRSLAGELPQAAGLGRPRVEPRQVGGHVEELQLRLLAVGPRRLQQHHGRRPQVEGVDPGAAGVVVEEHDAPGHRLAFEAAAVPAVGQRPFQAAGRQGRRAHEVGPHAEEPQRLATRLRAEALVDWDGDGELVVVDLADADGLQFGGEPVGCLGDPGVAGHPGGGGGEGGHGAAESVLQIRRGLRGRGGGQQGGEQERGEGEMTETHRMLRDLWT